MIPHNLIRQFSASSRRRGEDYAEQGRVRVSSEDPHHIHAQVRGTSMYVVDLHHSKRGWSMSCTCPAWMDYGPCKHIWAVLITADRHGLFDGASNNRSSAARKPPAPAWKKRLRAALRDAEPRRADERPAEWPAAHVIDYTIQTGASSAEKLILQVSARPAAKPPGKTRPVAFQDDSWLHAPDPLDRQIAHMLLGARPTYSFTSYAEPQRRFELARSMFETTLRLICATGRCFFEPMPGAPLEGPLVWDEGAHFGLRVRIVRDPKPGSWRLQGRLARPGEELAIEDIVALTAQGIVVQHGLLSRFDAAGAEPFFTMLQMGEQLSVPDADLFEFAAELHLMPDAPPIELPPELEIEEAHPTPIPGLRVHSERDWRFNQN